MSIVSYYALLISLLRRKSLFTEILFIIWTTLCVLPYGNRCRQEICMKETQTNMEESERDTKRDNSEQEKDSDQPRQNEELVPKRDVASVTWT